METVTARIPEEEKKLLEQIGEEEGSPQAEVLRKIIEKGVDEWRREKALRLLRENSVTLRKAAEIAGMSYLEMLEMVSEEDVKSGYDAEELQRDIERL